MATALPTPSLGSPAPAAAVAAEAQAPAHESSNILPSPPLPPPQDQSVVLAAAVVEMSDLSPSNSRRGTAGTGTATETNTGAGVVNEVSPPAADSFSAAPSASHVPISPTTTNMAEPNATSPAASAASAPAPIITSSPPSAPGITRLDSVAIGPSTDIPPTPIDPSSTTGPVLMITLLLTTGARHPYKIDEKYLTKRNVAVKDPFQISVYTLKELILREWREEWEQPPSSPSSIRLIYFGRLLDDKVALKECRFSPESANVVHMTVRPQDIVDEEDASKSKALARDRDGGENTAGCRCVIL